MKTTLLFLAVPLFISGCGIADDFYIDDHQITGPEALTVTKVYPGVARFTVAQEIATTTDLSPEAFSSRVVVERVAQANDTPFAYGVNTFSVMPLKLCWELMTDERYTYSLGGSINFYYLRDNYFAQVANIETYKDKVGKRGGTKYFYKNFFMQVCFRPQTESSGRLFFRYQYNWQQGYWRTGFHQAQVGYSVFLTRQLKQG